jgi:hypothetical protein
MEFGMEVTLFASGAMLFVLCDLIGSISVWLYEKARLMQAERKRLKEK